MHDTQGQNRKKINLALQGGAAHGAFTWGVLDYLLEDGRLEFEGISASSSGAINAALMADGLIRGGPADARKRLADFWRAASIDGNLPTAQRTALDRLFWFLPSGVSPVQTWITTITRVLSPYELNPLNINPLKDLFERFVDFDAIRSCTDLQFYVTATNVHTGRLRIFPRDKINADVIMASACLPFLFQAVEIEGVPYWDGAYISNPAIFPFFRSTNIEDVLLVQIHPVERHETPRTAQEILNRVSELTFNASLLAEFRAIDFVRRLIDQHRLPRGTGPGEYRRVNVHRIALGESFRKLSAASMLNSDYDFFLMLHKGGRRAAKNFLKEHFDDIGRDSTIDFAAETRREWA